MSIRVGETFDHPGDPRPVVGKDALPRVGLRLVLDRIVEHSRERHVLVTTPLDDGATTIGRWAMYATSPPLRIWLSCSFAAYATALPNR